MKIIFAIKNLYLSVGGAERVFCEVASNLVNRGHEIIILTFDPIGSSSFYHLDSKIRKIYLPVGDSSSPANLIDSFSRIKALRKVIKEEKPSAVVGFMHSIYILIAFALTGISIPVIASEHIVMDHYRRKPFQLALLYISSFLVEKYTILSSSIKKSYPFYIKRKMIIIPNPIKKFEIKNFSRNLKERKIILNVGRLEHQKDHLTLIKAFSKIATSFPEWDLIIIGEGSLKNEIRKEIDLLNLKKRIFLKDFTKKLETEYFQADVFVVSSLYESFGLVTAEAMSAGLPCIGFADCPGTNELIINEKTGLLVKNLGDRSSSLAKGLKRLLEDKAYRIRLGKKSKKLINAQYSKDEIMNSWEKLLYNAIRN